MSQDQPRKRLSQYLLRDQTRTAIDVTTGALALALVVWGIFSVPVDILTQSPSASTFVDDVLVFLPWLKNLKFYGPGGEKSLYLHCVYFLVGMPVLILFTLRSLRPVNFKSRYDLAVSICIAVVALLLFFGIYQLIDGSRSLRGADRIFLDPVMAPIFALGHAYLVWCFVTILVSTLLSIPFVEKQR